ncbi:hypothetical protein ACRAWF_36895 [Streptomyces sp. L7]
MALSPAAAALPRSSAGWALLAIPFSVGRRRSARPVLTRCRRRSLNGVQPRLKYSLARN